MFVRSLGVDSRYRKHAQNPSISTPSLAQTCSFDTASFQTEYISMFIPQIFAPRGEDGMNVFRSTNRCDRGNSRRVFQTNMSSTRRANPMLTSLDPPNVLSGRLASKIETQELKKEKQHHLSATSIRNNSNTQTRKCPDPHLNQPGGFVDSRIP